MTGCTAVQKFAEQNCVEQTHCNMLILWQGHLYADVANDDGKCVRQSKLNTFADSMLQSLHALGGMTGCTAVQKLAEQNCVEQTHCNMLIQGILGHKPRLRLHK